MILVVTTVQKGKDVHVNISGVLDENATLPDFNDEIFGQMIVNLEGLKMINSLGTRRWLKWIKSIRARGGIVLSKCSPPFISQANVLQNFVPQGAKVESLNVPYLCTKCSHESLVLFTVGKDTDAPDIRPCGECGGEAEMDVIKAKYFHFLKAA